MKKYFDRSFSQSICCSVTALALLSFVSGVSIGAEPVKPSKSSAKPDAAVKASKPSALQTTAYSGPTETASALRLTAGKSTVVRLPSETSRLSIGNPDVADVVLINAREIYILGKKNGTTNVFIWAKNGHTTVMDVAVGVDTGTLKSRLNELVPSEKAVSVDSLGDSLVLGGHISDPMKLQRLVSLAEVFSGGKKVVNLMYVDGPQQVMLEVKVAEVSKTLLDKLGAEWLVTRQIRGGTFNLLTQLLTDSSSIATGSTGSGNTNIALDAEVKNGLVKILAEPTIMAISGQEGSFLAGGKIYIPVPQSGSLGTSSITLEEKEFGVGLRFTPTVLEEGRINLRVTPEVSELSKTGTTISSLSGQINILPTITTRRASTTVQLRDGESFAIGGLIKNNVSESVKAFPILGELPVIGALFRSSEFQTDRSELVFIVTPRLVKPLPPNYGLPTDSFIEPSRSEFFMEGRLEGKSRDTTTTPGASSPSAEHSSTAPASPAGGFDLGK